MSWGPNYEPMTSYNWGDQLMKIADSIVALKAARVKKASDEANTAKTKSETAYYNQKQQEAADTAAKEASYGSQFQDAVAKAKAAATNRDTTSTLSQINLNGMGGDNAPTPQPARGPQLPFTGSVLDKNVNPNPNMDPSAPPPQTYPGLAPLPTSSPIAGSPSEASLQAGQANLNAGSRDMGKTRVSMLDEAGGTAFLGNKYTPQATDVYNSMKAQDTADLTAQEKADALKQAAELKREMLAQKSAENELNRQNQKQMHDDTMSATKGQKDFNIGQKQEQFIQNKLTKLGDEIDPSKNVRNAFSISKIGFDRAERLQSLAEAFKNGNLIRDAEIEELAIGLNQMLSGASQGSQKQVESLVPKTAMGNAMKLKQWLTNDVTGMNQKEFVDRMNTSIIREKNTMADQIKRTQFQKVAKYNFVRKADPDGWEEVLLSYGVDPVEYDAWAKNGHKQFTAVQQPEEVKPSLGGGASTKKTFDDLWGK